jgi:purine-cytosine permease-like protein
MNSVTVDISNFMEFLKMWIVLFLQIHILEYYLFCLELHYASLTRYERMEHLMATVNITISSSYFQV